MRVLILGGRAPVALDLARRFRDNGDTAFVGDSGPCRLSGWSHAVTESLWVPAPREAPLAFADSIAAHIRERRIDLVIPTCEEVFYLSRYRSRLPGSCSVLVDEFEKLKSLHSKNAFLGIAQASGIDVPASALVADLAGAKDWADKRPVVLKPEYSRFGEHTRIYSRGIDWDAPPLDPVGDWVVQEYRPGRELCSYSICLGGCVTAHVTYQPKYRLAISSSYYFEKVSAPEIQQAVSRLAAAIHFTGQLSFDWIESACGKYCVLECNPRAVSGLHLFASTQSIPAAMTNPNLPVMECSTTRPKMLGVVMASVGLWRALRTRSAATWLNDFRRADDIISIPGDRVPYLGSLADLAGYARRSFLARCSLRQATTRDIEWDGESIG